MVKNEVIPGVYRSSHPTIHDYSAGMVDLKIKSIVDLCSADDALNALRYPYWAARDKGWLCKFNYRAFPMILGDCTVEMLDAAVAIIDTMPKPCLIHCIRGIDRTGAIAAALRIRSGASVELALEERMSYNPLEIYSSYSTTLRKWAKERGYGG